MQNKIATNDHTDTFAHDICRDIIGKPDPITNLRPIKFYVPEKEDKVEKLYRFERQRVQQWNTRFWKRHNEMFKKEKENYQRQYMKNNNVNHQDELSKFYKDFLDRNWKTHCRYNLDWYKKNFYLSSLALKVNIHRFLKYCKLGF